MRRPLIALVAVALLATGACGGDEGSDFAADDRPAATRLDTTAVFGWTELGEEYEGVEVGNIEVPIDYDDPSSGTFDLYIARHLASDPEARIGTLVVNPGGPGFGASDWAIFAEQSYDEELLARFDIVGWDPRGTGLSTPAIDCTDDYDRYFADIDITPDDDAERQLTIDLAEEFQSQCASKNATIIDHIGTNNSARDIDTIRQALGEAQISYFGFSYGSELGATWATLFPDTVRAAVLDGSVDPDADLQTASLTQSAGFELSLTTFLAQCSDDDECVFHNDGDSEDAFDVLMDRVDDQPIASVEGRPAVNRAVAVTATAQAMYSQTLWPTLAQALADAQSGDGAGLLELHDRYVQRLVDGTYPNTLEAFQTITCMDRADRPTTGEDDALAERQREVAPRLSPSTVGSYQCTFYPPSTDPRIEVTGAGAAPILVVGTTGDPATPLAGTQAMADALEDAVLVAVVAEQHTGYGANDCSIDVIDRYLVDLVMPEEGTRCE